MYIFEIEKRNLNLLILLKLILKHHGSNDEQQMPD